MKKVSDSQYGNLKDWIKNFEPVWATGVWLGRRRFDKDVERLTRLGILPSFIWQLTINESTSEIEISPHDLDDDEHVGLIAVRRHFFHSFSSTGEFPESRFSAGKSIPCSKCDESGYNRNGGDCSKCLGEGFLLELNKDVTQFSNLTEDLNGAFLGANRYQDEIAKFRAWEKRYMPVFWTFDEGIEPAIELLEELGVGQEHLWTSIYEYREHSVANLLVEYIDYQDIEDSPGSVSLYVTKNPVDEWFPSIGIDCSDGYSCLACSGNDEDCDVCNGEEPAYVEFQSTSYPGDLQILRQNFGH